MLQASTLKFLKDLKQHNNKPWFEENRKNYEAAKENFTSVVAEIIKGIAKFDPPIGTLSPKDCTFRINKDVRFSKDKTPYKTNMAASFTLGGKKVDGAGYYFHCEPGQSYVAGGCYMPLPPDLAKIRQEIDYSFDEFKKIINHKSFKKYFPKGIEGIQTLVRPPKGYDESNPALEYLKMKGFIVMRSFTDAELQDKKVLKEILQSFEAMKPLIDFFNYAVQ